MVGLKKNITCALIKHSCQFLLHYVVYMYYCIFIQDTALSKFFKYFLEHQYEMGTEQEEKELSTRILGLRSASPEPLVQFLYPVLNGLFSILVRQTFSKEAAIVQQSGFASLAQITNRIQTRLDLPQDKHGHNILLASYLQHVLVAPVGQPLHSSKSKSATMGPRSGSSPDREKKPYPGSLKLSNDEVTSMFCKSFLILIPCFIYLYRVISDGG